MPLQQGNKNCITDVSGVKVGHVTLYEKINEEDTICTGVTAILPHEGNLFYEKIHAASYVINGYGKSTGLIQLDELGLLESPIMLSNTFSVGPVLEGTLRYMLDQNKEIGNSAGTINIVVGECNDSMLNSIRIQAIKPEHAKMAIENASSGACEQGAVGAGKGMVCFQYKGGIGTASRIVTAADKKYTVGCLVLSNFGKREQALFAKFPTIEAKSPDGSIMMVIATDAPLYDRQLKRLAKHTTAGLARTGSHIAHGSGDIAIAFSTANKHNHNANSHTESMEYIRDHHQVMNQLFQAVIESTEEAIINSLKYAETTEGKGGKVIDKAPINLFH
ncbi:DmpA family aminopeptidase [Ornithinibacillus halophilus]|uniref:D-aminopeptidase n=1 Tax=Ornithinibacillus halophilus TaxID=930117 RepID=A0A1M5EVN0_9BACI|nr:P1 family peptidase [Ornithinibacillus halophilus]SHF83295.1 D-aminopeptidase [Ornithinibacillus halophilus]